MTRVLLVTSAYSAFMRGHPAIKLALQQADEISLNPVILGELLAGFLRGKQRKKNEQELRTLLASPRTHSGRGRASGPQRLVRQQGAIPAGR